VEQYLLCCTLVLVLLVIIFFVVPRMVLCFGFVMKMVLITH